MARTRKTKVFVSYSRHDEELVRPLAGLLGVAAGDAVFLDVSALKPGDLWDEKILGAVKEASVFVLCWCCACESSSFVAKEIGTALSSGGKKLVPVLFCSAPLPPGMADRQWIDLRGKIVHECPAPHKKKPSSQHINQVTRPRVVLDYFEDPLPASDFASPPEAEPRVPIVRSTHAVSKREQTRNAIVLTICFAAVTYLAATQQLGTPAPPSGHRTLREGIPHSSSLGVFRMAAIVVLDLVILAVFGLLLHIIVASVRIWMDRRKAERIAATATSYFRGLAGFEGLAGREPDGGANP